jgi:hypothetical protein
MSLERIVTAAEELALIETGRGMAGGTSLPARDSLLLELILVGFWMVVIAWIGFAIWRNSRHSKSSPPR